MFSLILFMISTAAFVFFNGVTVKLLVHLRITNKTGWLNTREKMNSIPLLRS